MTAPPSPVAQILADMLKHLLMGDANTAMNTLGGGGAPGPMGGGGGGMPSPMGGGGMPPPMPSEPPGPPPGGPPMPPKGPPHAAPPKPGADKKPPPKKARRGAMSAMPKKGK